MGGPQTNKHFSHSILKKEGSLEPRISLTLREVKTFKDLKSGRLFGQGVQTKSLQDIQYWQWMERLILLSGLGLLCSSTWKLMFSVPKISSNKYRNAGGWWTTCTMGVLLVSGTCSWKFLRPGWHRRQEE